MSRAHRPRNCTDLAVLSIILLRRGGGCKTAKFLILPYVVTPTIHYSENSHEL